MPIKRAAYKQLRADKKKRLKNLRAISEVKTLVRKLNSLIAEGNEASARNHLKEVVSKLNKAVTKRIVHKNTASRKISRLAIKIDRAFKSKKK
jgi:small subunit ribosomal protein S20